MFGHSSRDWAILIRMILFHRLIMMDKVLFDLLNKVHTRWGYIFMFQLGQLPQQAFFLFAHFFGNLDIHLYQQIPQPHDSRIRHAMLLKSKNIAGLSSAWDY
jgi:hypothetical protein